MKIQPIRSEDDYDKALATVERIWGAEQGTPNGDRLDVLLILIEDYEAKHHAIAPPDPIEAIKFRMEQMNLTRKDLESIIGSRGRVTEVINGKRPLSLAMIRRLHAHLGIPLESLIKGSEETASNQAFKPTSLPPRLRRSGRAAA